MSDYGSFQDGIYAGGLAARHSRLPFTFDELEARAGEEQDRKAFDNDPGVDGDETNQRANFA